MKKSLLFGLLIVLFSAVGCLISEEEEGTGTLKVTVNTSTVVWSYPSYVSGENELAQYLVYEGATDRTDGDYLAITDDHYVFRYPTVGGNGKTSSVSTNYYDTSLAGFKVASNYKNTFVALDENSNVVYKFGNKRNYVYLFNTLEQKSDNNPVLYNGESTTNGGEITITGIKPGTYYVVAFYDYASGGNVQNILNRYDRYAIYAETVDALTGNSTPYYDKAGTITIAENATETIALVIHENWVLGKPKATYTGGEYEMGRYYLKEGETIPAP